jgi:hypothetical protein
MILLPGRHSGWARLVTQQAPQAAAQAGSLEYGRWVQPAAMGDRYGPAQRQKAWIENRDKALQNLDAMVEQEKVRKEACQVAFPAMGKNDPNTLAVDQIMTEMASHFDDGEKIYVLGALAKIIPAFEHPPGSLRGVI